MSAINTFAEGLIKGGWESFEVVDSRFTLMKHEGITFIFSSDKGIKEKKIIGGLGEISEIFIKNIIKAFFSFFIFC